MNKTSDLYVFELSLAYQPSSKEEKEHWIHNKQSCIIVGFMINLGGISENTSCKDTSMTSIAFM
jgi:hypothetical protein